MARVLYGTHSSSPTLAYELYADQTGGSGNNRTIKITLKLKCGGSSLDWHGYAMDWRAYVNGTWSSWTPAKGTETWRGGMGWRTYTWTHTTNVGTSSSKSITVGFATNTHGGSESWDTSKTGSFTVSATNTPPVLSGTVTTSPSGIIPENTKSIKITSPVATDSNGNLKGYSAQVSINGGGWKKIYTGSSREFTHDISKYMEQGTTFKYAFEAYDSSNAFSSFVFSSMVTRNKFSGDVLTSSSSIGYNTGAISFESTGASNTNGNTSFTRRLTCSGITIYNNTTTGTTWSVTIYKSGTVPKTPYIKFSDIKNKFSSTEYKGNLIFTVETKNIYGTTKKATKSISVNLQTTPNPVPNCTIATNSNSTAYKTVSSTNNKYFLPDGSSVVRVDWGAGSGKLGEPISYEVYVSYGSTTSWKKIATVNSLYYNHVIPKQSSSTSFKYKIRTKTNYGTYADRDTSAQTLHFYNHPSLTVGTITRGSTTADVVITVKSNSSIPNINTIGTWVVKNKGTSVQVGKGGNLTVSQNAQTINATSLTDEGLYDLVVTYRDDTGFSANKTTIIPIGANSPIFFVNKYGVGVGGVKANTSNSLNIKGNVAVSDSINKLGTSQSWVSGAGGSGALINMTTKNGYNPLTRQKTTSGAWTMGTYTTEELLFSYMSDDRISAGTNTLNGQIKFPHNITGTVYTTGNKPKPSELGAMATYKGENEGSYYGMRAKEDSNTDWIRTTRAGLIPFSNGVGSLGTSSWRFSGVYGEGGNFGGTAIDENSMVFPSGSNWKSINFRRTHENHTNNVRFGIGLSDNRVGATVEVNNGTGTEAKTKLDITEKGMSLINYSNSINSDKTCYLSFHREGGQISKRVAYLGVPQTGSNNTYLVSEKGSLTFRSEYEQAKTGVMLDTGGYFRPETTNYWAIGHPSYRWSTVYCSALNNTSDARLKENIQYISKDNTNTLDISENTISSSDLYEFVRDDLSLATYDYIVEETTTTHGIENMKDKIGFIAQDIVDTKVGKHIIRKDRVVTDENIPSALKEGDDMLSCDLANYINVLAGALKASIYEIEELKIKIRELEINQPMAL